MAKHKRVYLNFPSSIIKGWWESGEKFEGVINLAFYFHVLYQSMKLKEGMTNWEYVYKIFSDNILLGVTFDKYMNMLEQPLSKKAIQQIKSGRFKGQAWMSVENELFQKALNFNDFNSQIEFIAYLSIKSLLGNKIFRLINKKKLATRMIGETSLNTKLDDLPQNLKTIFKTRYKFDKLRDNLFNHYGIAFFAYKSTKGFYVSLAKDKNTGKGDIAFLKKQVDKLINEAKAKKANSLHEVTARVKNNSTLNKNDDDKECKKNKEVGEDTEVLKPEINSTLNKSSTLNKKVDDKEIPF